MPSAGKHAAGKPKRYTVPLGTKLENMLHTHMAV
jgi:hypothetical protein